MPWDIGYHQSAGGPAIGYHFAAESGSITPDSIDSTEEWGSPNVFNAGDQQDISPDSIPRSEEWGSPSVAGPVNPDSIESTEEWGEPVVNAESTVIATSIVSTEEWGSPNVSIVEVVEAGSIESTEAWGEPTVSTRPQYVFADSIESTQAWGDATVSGGVDTLQVFVAGIDRSAWLNVGASSLDSQTKGRWTGLLRFHNYPAGDASLEEWIPAIGQIVLVQEFGRTLFRGCITAISVGRYLSTNVLPYDCRIQDKSAITERRAVLKSYDAEMDAADIIRDIVATALNKEGIIIDPALPASLGALGTRTSPMIYVSQAFDLISDVLGLQWFIDLNQILRFVNPTAADDAPLDITEISTNWRDINVEISLRDYRNKQYVVSNRAILPAGSEDDAGSGAAPSITESYTLLDAGGGIGYQLEARNFDWPLPDGWLVTKLPVGSLLSLKINGDAQTIYQNTDPAYAAFLDSTGFTAQAFTWQSSTVLIRPVLAMSAGDLIQINYVANIGSGGAAVVEDPVLTVESNDPELGELVGTCGSGRWDHIDQVNNVNTQEELNAIARGLLDRSGVVPKVVQFETDYPGLEVGQKLFADIPRMLLDAEDLFITALSGSSLGFDLGHESSFRWKVTASNAINPNSWKWWQNLWRRSQHPEPILRIVTTTIVLGAGASIIAGANVSNPGPLSSTGKLRRVRGKFANPPTGQSLKIQVSIDGTPILANPGLVIPAGELDEVILTSFAQPTVYGYQGQYVTITLTYAATGGAIAPAKNGTVVLEWEVG